MASIERALKLCFARLLTPNLNFSKNLQKSFLSALNLWILRCAQYNKFRLSPKFYGLLRLLFIKAHNNDSSCHFEHSEKKLNVTRKKLNLK